MVQYIGLYITLNNITPKN